MLKRLSSWESNAYIREINISLNMFLSFILSQYDEMLLSLFKKINYSIYLPEKYLIKGIVKFQISFVSV